LSFFEVLVLFFIQELSFNLGSVNGGSLIAVRRLFLGVFAELQKATVKLCHASLSVCPHGTAQLPLNGFS